jgi:NADPH:quinone reductase
MRAVGVTEFGGPEVLHIVDLPDPVAGPGELRIRVHAAAVNPIDTFLRAGLRAELLKDVPPPYVPGMDAAGVVDQIGPEVSAALDVGAHVMAFVLQHGAHGAYCELLAVPAESVARAPAGATDAEAATLPLNGLTARQAFDLLRLEPGQTLGVTGAAGAVGGYAVQMGKAAGLRVIADASEADQQLVSNLGADVVVPRGPQFAGWVRAAVPAGVDAVIDLARLNELVIPAVRDDGKIATVRGFRAAAARGITYCPVVVYSYAREQAKIDQLRQQVEAGELTPRVARILPAERAAEAHRILEAGGTRGRLILKF